MKRAITRLVRFGWRASRNLVCALPGGQGLLFPPGELANRFGRGDAEYALQVYQHHAQQLQRSGFVGASNILEVGPGRNLGTALLWWSRAFAQHGHDARVTLWDVYANADPTNNTTYWKRLAHNIVDALRVVDKEKFLLSHSQLDVLNEVARGACVPNIIYRVCSIERLTCGVNEQSFDLVYSHAALEHVWKIQTFWRLARALTAVNGWHSHRIDLSDHGRRKSNYLEMLEWSPLAWWLMMRFQPGAINRWRAREFEAAIASNGIRILSAAREQQVSLPIPCRYLAEPFRSLDEAELRTTAIDLVGRCEPREGCRD